jgi:TrmH family RNA methyltransferase
MIKVVLIQPAVPGNIGAVARTIKNFGHTDLVLVDPQCDHLAEEAIARSKHARDVLESAEVIGFEALEQYDYLIGTTSVLGNAFNLPRSPVSPKELVELLENKLEANIGMVFGPEGTGLTNELLLKMDFTVAIPTHKEYHSLNLSHSVAIVLYELFQAFGEDKIGDDIDLMSVDEKEQALKTVDKILDEYDFKTDMKRETQRRLWRRMIGRTFLSKREYFALMGFFKRMLEGKKPE